MSKTTNQSIESPYGDNKINDIENVTPSEKLPSSTNVLTDEVDSYTVEEVNSFDEMELKQELLRGIYSYGFESPSSIQKRAIVPLYKGYDIIGQSQSGTGKTGAFTIGTLQRVCEKDDFTQALILAPTRELAEQIYKVISCLSSNLKDLEIELSIGGIRSKSYNRWDKPKTKHIIIGTPGRILDNLKRKRIDISKLKTIVLDEADEMLSKGFLEQIHDIFHFVPPEAQVALFSATLPKEIFDITVKFMKNPLNILIKKEEITLDGIKQFYIALEKRSHKMDCLFDIFEMISVTQAIIYVNTKKMAEELHYQLTNEGFSVSVITGNMPQEERKNVMVDFRSGKTRVLLSTDMLARGIDVQQVSLVLNYDLPREKETYIHRIGRSGRFGRKGVAINLVTKDEYENLRLLEQFYQTKVEELPQNFADFI
jgi:translation initiation factor 4A